MDHSEALRLQAAERYVLDELSPELREEYEEHCFCCQECAKDLKATVAFVATARAVFKTEGREDTRTGQATSPVIGTWFSWLRPAVAIPVFAALILLVGYQNFVMIPKLKHGSVATQAGLDGDFVSFIGASSRSEGAKSFQIHANKPIVLEVDIPVTDEFGSYVCEIQNAAGGPVYDDEISADDAKRTVHLIVPKGALTAGTYNFVIFGQRPSLVGTASRTEISRFRFTLAFVR